MLEVTKERFFIQEKHFVTEIGPWIAQKYRNPSF